MDFFDLHCDTAYEIYKTKQNLRKNNLAVSFEKGNCFDNWNQFFAIWIKDDLPDPFLSYKKIVDYLKAQISLCKNKNLTAFITLEGGAAIESARCLYQMYNDGVKTVALTWNGKNKIASGAGCTGGLTDFGYGIISEMNRLKMVVDVSHLNEESFFDVIKVADNVIATHSCCESVFSHRRNLTDDQLLKIAEKGGIIGICPYPAFLGLDSFEGVYRNILHMSELGLEKNIAFGSDFDGAQMSDNLSDVSKIPSLVACLRKKGVSEELCERIFYKNAAEYFKKLME